MLLSNPSRADDWRDLYVGAGIGRATLDLTNTINFRGFKDEDTAFKLMAGYQFTNNFAIEGSYMDIGNPRHDSLKAEFQVFTIAAVSKVRLRLFSLYGKAGLGYWKNTVHDDQGSVFRDTSVDPWLGAGIQYDIGQFALRADFDLISLHLLDAFDSKPGNDGWVESWSITAIRYFR